MTKYVIRRRRITYATRAHKAILYKGTKTKHAFGVVGDYIVMKSVYIFDSHQAASLKVQEIRKEMGSRSQKYVFEVCPK